MNALDELKNKLRAGGGKSLTALELAVLFAREITVTEHERAAAELAAICARVGELERERDELQKINKKLESLLYSHHEWGFIKRAAQGPMTEPCELCGNGKLAAALAKGAK